MLKYSENKFPTMGRFNYNKWNIKIQTSVVEVWTRNFSVWHIFTGMKLQIEAWLLCKMVVKFTIMGEEFDGREIIMFDSEWYMKREDY